MIQNVRTRLVAPGHPAPAGVEALALEPWTALTHDVDRLARTLLGDAPHTPDDADASAWVPPVDVEEREDAIRLAVEVPGVDPEAITVTVDRRVLTVSGERRLARDAGGRSAHRIERRFGRFTRSLALPPTVDADRITARSEHGVLYLELPKRPEAQPRRIAINTGAAARPGDAPDGEVRQLATDGDRA